MVTGEIFSVVLPWFRCGIALSLFIAYISEREILMLAGNPVDFGPGFVMGSQCPWSEKDEQFQLYS
jgi:hypothetical protein